MLSVWDWAGEDRLGMCGGPAVREQLLKALVIRVDAEEKVAHVGPGFDTMTLGPCKNRIQHGGSWSRCFTAQEKPVFAVMQSSA